MCASAKCTLQQTACAAATGRPGSAADCEYSRCTSAHPVRHPRSKRSVTGSSTPWQLSSLVQPAAQPHRPQHLVRRQLGEGPPFGVGVARVRQQGGGAQHVALQVEGGTGRTLPGFKSSRGYLGSVRRQGGSTRQPAELSKQRQEVALGSAQF